MYKTTVEYEDFNGEKKKRTLYFNLSQSELTESHEKKTISLYYS